MGSFYQWLLSFKMTFAVKRNVYNRRVNVVRRRDECRMDEQEEIHCDLYTCEIRQLCYYTICIITVIRAILWRDRFPGYRIVSCPFHDFLVDKINSAERRFKRISCFKTSRISFTVRPLLDGGAFIFWCILYTETYYWRSLIFSMYITNSTPPFRVVKIF